MIVISWPLFTLIIIVVIGLTVFIYSKINKAKKQLAIALQQLEAGNEKAKKHQRDVDQYVLGVTAMSAKIFVQNRAFLEQTAKGAFNLVSAELREQIIASQQSIVLPNNNATKQSLETTYKTTYRGNNGCCNNYQNYY